MTPEGEFVFFCGNISEAFKLTSWRWPSGAAPCPLGQPCGVIPEVLSTSPSPQPTKKTAVVVCAVSPRSGAFSTSSHPCALTAKSPSYWESSVPRRFSGGAAQQKPCGASAGPGFHTGHSLLFWFFTRQSCCGRSSQGARQALSREKIVRHTRAQQNSPPLMAPRRQRQRHSFLPLLLVISFWLQSSASTGLPKCPAKGRNLRVVGSGSWWCPSLARPFGGIYFKHVLKTIC